MTIASQCHIRAVIQLTRWIANVVQSTRITVGAVVTRFAAASAIPKTARHGGGVWAARPNEVVAFVQATRVQVESSGTNLAVRPGESPGATACARPVGTADRNRMAVARHGNIGASVDTQWVSHVAGGTSFALHTIVALQARADTRSLHIRNVRSVPTAADVDGRTVVLDTEGVFGEAYCAKFALSASIILLAAAHTASRRTRDPAVTVATDGGIKTRLDAAGIASVPAEAHVALTRRPVSCLAYVAQSARKAGSALIASRSCPPLRADGTVGLF